MIIVKTEQEIDAMREPCAIVRDTLTYIGSLVRPGVSTQELDERAEAYIRSRGAVPSCLGYCGYPASICASVNEEVVHGIPGPRTLREGDIVSIDLCAYKNGFHGDGARTFAVGKMELASDELPTDGDIRIRCTVTNTGDRTGDQVLQLYYHFSGAHVIRPVKQLVGFVRVTLAPGESKTAEFTLKAAQLGYYNEDMDFVVEPGPAELSLGTSSADICDTRAIRLTGSPVGLMGHRSYTCAVSVS